MMVSLSKTLSARDLSLLVPCYNAEAYIDEFVAHIEAMDFDEVIFYDDGSTDGTLELLKKTGYKYIHSSINKGPGYARNRLAELCKSKYIHFHDVDDRFNVDFINIVLPYFKEEPDVVVGDADWIIRQTGQLQIQWRYDPAEALKDPLQYFITHPLGIINTVYKRSSFLGVNGFNEEIKCWEDSDLHVKIAANSAKFAIISKVIAYSMRHENGISSDQSWCWRCRFKFLKSYLTELPPQYLYTILSELAKCAQSFYDAGLMKDFNDCINICEQQGLRLPVSKNRLINFVKTLPLPARVPYDLIKAYKKIITKIRT